LLALLITPVSYSLFDSFGQWCDRLKARFGRTTTIPAVAPVAVAASTRATTANLDH
jgi:hypothetical protein